ncbi:exostosin domain-containing protein [Flavivirga aquatica]|nr:exostosin family protein [Flavivirga aquatica]
MLKLYTDKTFLTEVHRRHVFPLLFDLHFQKNTTLLNYYELTDTIANCDIVVFPIDYNSFYKFNKAFKNLNDEAKKYKKRIWIYTSGDYGFTVYIPNSYNFRLGGFNSKLDSNTFILPSFINDPYKNVLKQSFLTLEKKTKPNIGFVGHSQSGLIKFVKEYLSYLKSNLKRKFENKLEDKQTFYPSSIKRARYLGILTRNKKIDTDFILRNNYRGGVKNKIEKEQSTKEFYENMYNSAYTFCSRGVGNFSVRFYETLAMGRIPVLLNTDCRLPLENKIKWEKHIVIIQENKSNTLAQKILEFHESKSNLEFQALQKSNRMLWETHLRRDAYFIKIHNSFINIENRNNV